MMEVEAGGAGGAGAGNQNPPAAAGGGSSATASASTNSRAPSQQQQQQSAPSAVNPSRGNPAPTTKLPAAPVVGAGARPPAGLKAAAGGNDGVPALHQQPQPQPPAHVPTATAGSMQSKIKMEGGITTVGAMPAMAVVAGGQLPSPAQAETVKQKQQQQPQPAMIHQELNAIIGQKRSPPPPHQQLQPPGVNSHGKQMPSPASASSSSIPTAAPHVGVAPATLPQPHPARSLHQGSQQGLPQAAVLAVPAGGQRLAAGGGNKAGGVAPIAAPRVASAATAAAAPVAQAHQGPRSSAGGRAPVTRGQTGTAAARGPTTTASGAGVSKSIEEACHAAALEDGVLHVASGGAGKQGAKGASHGVAGGGAGCGADAGPKPGKQKNGLRRGKWTPEEEAYANRLIVEFKSGLLPLTDGTTLRTFLSKLLNCDPMRISKKFVGQNCIGKQVFRRRQQAEMDQLSPDEIERSRQELAELERRFLERVAQTNRCKNSGPGGAKHGKDSATGQVAPDIPRRSQEYLAPNGQQVVTNPLLPPWMLPPMPAPSAAAPSAHGLAQLPHHPPPPPPQQQQQPQTQPLHLMMLAPADGLGLGHDGTGAGRLSQHPNAPATAAGGRVLRRAQAQAASPSTSTSVLSDAAVPAAVLAASAGLMPMMRNESQDSLAGFAQSLSSDALHLGDLPLPLPRNDASLGDLAGLNMFNNSPFPSADNLLGLVQQAQQAQQQQQQQQQAMATQAPPPPQQPQQQQLAQPAPNTAASSPTTTWEDAGADAGAGAGAAVDMPITDDGAAAAAAAPASAAASQSRRMPRVESATGLSSLRVMSGLNRNTSVEDFFSLVESGAIPAPDKDLLSKCVFPTNPRQQQPSPAQQSVVAFTGIGKSSAVVPAAAAAAASVTAAAAGDAAGPGKRTRGGAVGDGGGRAKQTKAGP